MVVALFDNHSCAKSSGDLLTWIGPVLPAHVALCVHNQLSGILWEIGLLGRDLSVFFTYLSLLYSSLFLFFFFFHSLYLYSAFLLHRASDPENPEVRKTMSHTGLVSGLSGRWERIKIRKLKSESSLGKAAQNRLLQSSPVQYFGSSFMGLNKLMLLFELCSPP